MRQLQATDYSGKELDTGQTMTLALFDDDQPAVLDGSLSVIAANDAGAVQLLNYQLDSNKIIITPAAELPAGRYRLEVWLTKDSAKSIYPSAGYLYFYVNDALTGVSGDKVKVISIDDIYNQVTSMINNANFGDIEGKLHIDDDGNLIYSTNDNKQDDEE